MAKNSDEDPTALYEFEEILLEALDLAQEAEQPCWIQLVLTVLTAVQEGLEDDFALVCDSFLRRTAEAQKQEQQLLPLHFVVNRVGRA